MNTILYIHISWNILIFKINNIKAFLNIPCCVNLLD